MSGLLAVIAPDERPLAPEVQARVMGAIAVRGSDRVSVWSEGGVVLGVSRAAWELGPGFSGPVLVVQDGDCVVVADASLYYRDDLRRRLAGKGVRAKGQTPSHLILAAYHAMGARCAEWLEGDFSFVLWDRRHRTVVAARDFAGTRPLFYAVLGDGTLVLASTIGAILQHPACTGALDLRTLGIDAAGLVLGVSEATCYDGISRLGSARRLVWMPGRVPDVSAFWQPIVREDPSAIAFDDAALELRSILAAAVHERIDSTATTAVWMSGGWDSTALFGAGQWTLDGDAGARLVPVSISHPAGDPGYEDDKIEETAARWGKRVAWLHARSTPLVNEIVTNSTAADEPLGHLFAGLNRGLAHTSRAIGARTALYGDAADFLFASSHVFLSDLLASGRLIQLAREWRVLASMGHGPREFFRSAIHPLLPKRANALLATLRGGRPIRAPFELAVPRWMDQQFSEQHELAMWARTAGTPPVAEKSACAEVQWGLTQSFYARNRAWLNQLALDEGVELRAPFCDRRVMEFAVKRPIAERNSMGEGKRLLRRAMDGLLPASVLASRPIKTGNLNGYFQADVSTAEASIREMIAERLVLADLGVVDPTRFRRAFDIFFRSGCSGPARIPLMYSLCTELWLRSHSERDAPVPAHVNSRRTADIDLAAAAFSGGHYDRTCVGQDSRHLRQEAYTCTIARSSCGTARFES